MSMRNQLYKRERYLKQVRPFYDDDLIKVITGMRRCGKSCLMLSIIDELRGRGARQSDIVYLDLDALGNRSIRDADSLEAAIMRASGGRAPRYLFIDEVQNASGFEEIVNGFRGEGSSVFITGSNSYLLSGELATKLTGRYIEVPMFTLSFSEYLGMKDHLAIGRGDDALEFAEWFKYGGFPKAVEFSQAEAKEAYISSVIDQVFEKDIRSRAKVRKWDVFERVQAYVINNFAAPTNLSNICKELRDSQGISITRETLGRYLRLLESAKVLYRCPRFDLKSRRSLAGGEKYYLADTGIYRARNTDARVGYGPALENVLFTHLVSKGYSVSVSKVGRLECDFIARKGDRYAYIQVCMTLADPKVEEREYRPFALIKDGWPRFVFTLDPLPLQRDGVRGVNIMRFLKEDGDLF